MRVLLAGATGFLGRHVWQALTDRGARVTTVGRRRPSWSPRHHSLDLADPGGAALGALLGAGGPAVLVNCAGATRADLPTLAAANIDIPAGLVAAAAGRPVRLVHVGSAAEYGWVEPGRHSVETDPAAPVGAYGLSKLAGTRVVTAARALGVDAVVLRVTNPVGPGAPAGSLAGDLVAQVRRARTGAGIGAVRVGPTDAVRDFVDVRDVAYAVVAATEADALTAPVVNVGSGRATAVKELVDTLVAVAGYHGEVHHDGGGSARTAAVPWQCADVGTARSALGWQPRLSLRTALADLWREPAWTPSASPNVEWS
ncbi:NAD-dependent epimerase/dehydratase family protein [Asanoa siamensis]|uniref:SnoG protein n=1 Tax=Asanoa siamensis TaxID=926357 RepID=A0ABQ4CM91_9ACTN|nr:NAD(P)-dependent oxidoreductase [Asanoa siamensis]GIF72098.1 snoG protein [Asanoa siamensis]